jgi:hypothetical protein
MEFLLKFNEFSGEKELITASSPEQTEIKFKKYLDSAGIEIVDKIPETTGMFCLDDKSGIYKIYKIYHDKEYEAYVHYCLQWLSWTEKQAATLFDDVPVDPPELIRS